MTNLPTITIGSEKQIAWATDIRNGVAEAIEAARVEKNLTWSPAQADVIARLMSVDIARFWIDNRGHEVYGWLSKAQYLATGGKLSY